MADVNDWGIKVSQEGSDVKSCPEEELVMSSSFNLLKSKIVGNTSIGNNLDTNHANDINNAHAQSFIAPSNSIVSVDIKLFKFNSPTDNIVVDITSVLGGTSLGTKSIATASLVSGAVNTFTFASPISVTPNQTYYLQISRSGSIDATNRWAAYIAFNTNPYPDGQAYSESGGVWTADSSATDYRFHVNFPLTIAHGFSYIPIFFTSVTQQTGQASIVGDDRTTRSDATNIILPPSTKYYIFYQSGV